MNWILKLDSEGNANVPNDRILKLTEKEKILVQIDSNQFINNIGLLLTNKTKKFQNAITPTIGQTIQSNQFDSLKFDVHELKMNPEGTWQTQIQAKQPGILSIQLMMINIVDQGTAKVIYLGPIIHVLVEPILPNHLTIPSLTIQTLLPTQLGVLSNWSAFIEQQISTGFNSFHLAPVQKLGMSESLYSIQDQLEFNKNLEINENDLKALIQKFSQKGILFFIDILLNHTSCDSKWLDQKSIYNCETQPNLEVAYQLDEIISNFSDSIKYTDINDNYQLDQLMNQLSQNIHEAKLWEYFSLDIQAILSKLLDQLQDQYHITLVKFEHELNESDNIFVLSGTQVANKLIQDNLFNQGYSRFGVFLNYDKVAKFLSLNQDKVAVDSLERALTNQNKFLIDQAKGYIQEAIENTRNQCFDLHIKQQKHQINDDYPFAKRYFSKVPNNRYAANNGWIMNVDSLENFAESPSNHFLRRTIIIWGDLIKLRYGKQKSDSPGLWQRMKQYVQKMALIFQGFRIDNAHSTPIEVGKYMMKQARKVNPKLIVFAELFTGSEVKDVVFTKELGINALVRESVNLVNTENVKGMMQYFSGNTQMAISAVQQFSKLNHYLLPCMIPSLIYDQSHDNQPVPIKHTFYHVLPLTAAIYSSLCLKASIYNYDQILDKHISVVNEKRLYTYYSNKWETIRRTHEYLITYIAKENEKVEIAGSFCDWNITPMNKQGLVYSLRINYHSAFEYKFIVNGVWKTDELINANKNTNHEAIIENENIQICRNLGGFRKDMNLLNKVLSEEYPFADFESIGDALVTTRQNKIRNQYIVMITFFAFRDRLPEKNVRVVLPGKFQKIEAIYKMEGDIEFLDNTTEFKGNQANIFKHYNINQFAQIYSYPDHDELQFAQSPISTVIILHCNLSHNQEESLSLLSADINFDSWYSKFTPQEFNFLLFGCDQEEYIRSGFGMYNVPNLGNLPYAGLIGLKHYFFKALMEPNTSHPIIVNIQAGNWLMSYIVNRLKTQHNQNIINFVDKLTIYFNHIQTFSLKQIPRYLITFILKLIDNIENFLLSQSKINREITKGFMNSFIQRLNVNAYAFIGYPKLSISAGLPHFSNGWSREWGRDTFMSFKGIILAQKLYDEGRQILLSYASCVRHGLIPNLLDEGKNPRYNCRDAVWWFLKAIKDYIETTNDLTILQENVQLKFLDDDIYTHQKKKTDGAVKTIKLKDIVYSIMQKHATGISYREWKAGLEIDSNMENEGFNINLKFDQQTGFIVGGNYRNCLTWMDKMGSSIKAGNKGYPATSRDGAPIELTALLKLTLDFLHKLNSQKQFEYDSVTIEGNVKLTWKEWSEFIQQNFEKFYYIPLQQEHIEDYNIIEKYIKRRGIYKDVVKSQKPWNEYYFRPNIVMAMSIAPELFNKKHALICLDLFEKVLIDTKSIGIKTLDSQEKEYNCTYDNQDDGFTFKLAHGFCYHNGPEWVFLTGFFIKALKNFLEPGSTKILNYLANQKQFLMQNSFESLPELTNGNGEFCKDSCSSQAWSIAQSIEVYY